MCLNVISIVLPNTYIMKTGFLIINTLAILLGGAGVAYLLVSVDVTQNPNTALVAFIVALMVFVWGAVTLLLYWMRTLFFGKHSMKSFIRSQRQGFFLALVTGIQLSLQGLLLWNVFSAGILTLVILLLEYYFLSQESTIIT